MRLNKFISNSGYCSRRKADELIFSGKVLVNNEPVFNPGLQINQDDKIIVDSKQIIGIDTKVYFMINKPIGYMSSVFDPHYDKFVVDLIDCQEHRIYPVGRLDVDSHGLLILTNDGDITNKISHPSHQIFKIYHVLVDKKLNKENENKFKTGIYIDDKYLCKGKIKLINDKFGKALYEVAISEGRNRQIRKMFKEVGSKVIDLKRVSIGKIKLGHLKEGEYRELTDKELEYLRGL